MTNKDVTHFITALTSLLSTNFYNFWQTYSTETLQQSGVLPAHLT